MLAMTRRIGEKITIGSDIALTILGVQGNQVRIGFRGDGSSSRRLSVNRRHDDVDI